MIKINLLLFIWFIQNKSKEPTKKVISSWENPKKLKVLQSNQSLKYLKNKELILFTKLIKNYPYRNKSESSLTVDENIYSMY